MTQKSQIHKFTHKHRKHKNYFLKEINLKTHKKREKIESMKYKLYKSVKPLVMTFFILHIKFF
jgi:hypothetical protein